MTDTEIDSQLEHVRHARRHRIAIIIIIAVVVEVGLAVLSYLGPALANLIRPVYLIAVLIAAGSIWHALRRQPGRDRRHGDRRGTARS